MEPHCYLKRFLKIEISFIREIAKPVNGQDETAHVHAPPLTVPSGFADGQSRRESLKWLPAHFNYEKETLQNQKRAAKHLRDWSPCSPIQRNGGWRSRPGVSPFISALTVARCPVTFPGEEPLLRDTLSTSRSVGRGTGAFIYAQSAVETRPVLTALRHAIRISIPCFPAAPNALALPGGNGIFTATPTERITHYTLLRKVVCQMGALPPLETPTRKGGTLPLHGAHTAFSCYPALRLYRLSKSQRGIDVVSLSK